MEHVGRRVAKLRRALRYSQSELGERVGVTQGSVSDWETGKTNPTLGNLRLVADLAGDPQPVFEWLQRGGEEPRLSVVPSGPVRSLTQNISAESFRMSRVSGTSKTAAVLLRRLRALHGETEEVLEALEELLNE